MKMCFELPNEQATHALAIKLAHCLTSPAILTFSGELGAGKTALIRSMLRALGVTSTIKSPTFSVVESYYISDSISNYSVHHFDLYRISDETELEAIGVRDYFSSDAVCCVEWPERAPDMLAHLDVNFVFKFDLNHEGRTLIATASSDIGRALLTCLGRAHG